MSRVGTLPDPLTEIRLTALQAVRGPNYWSRRPVVRMDLRVGAFDEISSADVPGVPEALAGALPGLVEHRCSIGERGGFLLRLRRGTYAPHIVEHVALELQNVIGHDVGYGKTRGGDEPGEYTLVFEHRHEAVGLRAAALALDVVQRAFAGTLGATPDSVAPMAAELAALARTDDVPRLRQRVLCAVTGGRARAEARGLILRGPAPDAAWAGPVREDDLVVDVAPSFVLAQGLPYSRSALAVVLDAEPVDVPPRYQDPERARQLLGVVIDAVERDGVVVLPAAEWELQDYARDRDCRVAVFSVDGPPSARDARVARASAWAADGRIVLERLGETTDGGPLAPDAPAPAQLAAALAAFSLRELTGAGEAPPCAPAAPSLEACARRADDPPVPPDA